MPSADIMQLPFTTREEILDSEARDLKKQSKNRHSSGSSESGITFSLTPKTISDLLILKGSHIMKTILLFSILFCAFAMPLCAETQEISEIKDDIATIKTDLAVLTSEVKNLKETIDKGFGNVETRFDSIEKGFDRLNNIIIACIGIPLAILAIGATVWGILTHKRSGKDRALEKQIETLTQEIETLKQQRIVNP